MESEERICFRTSNIFLKVKMTQKEGEIYLSSSGSLFRPKVEGQNLELHVGFPHGCQGPKKLGHVPLHFQTH